MSWRDLLGAPAHVVAPWTGGRDLRVGSRKFAIDGRLPPEWGWHRFVVDGGRKALWDGEAEPDPDFGEGRRVVRGWLVGDRLVPEGGAVRFQPDAARIVEDTLRVWLVEPGLDRFARVAAAEWDDGRWLYLRQEFPLGPEPDVERAYEDRAASLDGVREVPAALDLAFRWACYRRDQAEEARRRAEEERRRLEEEERLAAVRRQAERLVGTGAGRRQLARDDFEGAARAALRLSGAELLGWRELHGRDEVAVRYRHGGRRLECVVDRWTLRVIDAGICLTDHDTGERGDGLFTLESLPPVVAQAEREGRLVVFRHLE